MPNCLILFSRGSEGEQTSVAGLYRATTLEIIAAHVKNARHLGGRVKKRHAWEKYSVSPNRAMPATVNEYLCCQATFREFVEFIGNPLRELRTITSEDALGNRGHSR